MPETNAIGNIGRTRRHWLLADRRQGVPVFLLLSPTIIYVLLREAIAGYRIVQFDRLLEPDSYMRIVRIRDGLQTGWFTHLVTNDNAGLGSVVYWSHLLDAIILILRTPLRFVWNDLDALFIAASVTGPIFAALLTVVLAWTAAPLMGSGKIWLCIGPFAALRSTAIFTYGLLGFVHYHLLLVVLAVAAAGCAGRAAGGRTASGYWCGIWSAVGIWLSPEALPYVLMAMGTIGVAWCLQPASVTASLRGCGTAFAVAVVAAVLIDPPYGGLLSPEVDCISIVYAALAVLVCGAAWALAMLGPRIASLWGRIAVALPAGVFVIGIWLLLYPRVLQGLGGLVPSADAQAFFGAISEMNPIELDLNGISMLMTGLLAVVSALGLAWYRRSALWAYAAGCGIVVVTLAAMYIRFLGYAEAIGVAMLLAVLGAAGSSPRATTRQTAFRVAVAAAFLFGPMAAFALGGEAKSENSLKFCDVAEIAPVLRQESNAIVLTEISDTPEILWRTPVRAVGSLYHRSIGAFIRARNAWRTAPSDAVPEAVLASGANFILACDLSTRTALVSDLPPITLQDRLARHEIPSWLDEVGHAGGYHLYRIVNGPSAALDSGAGAAKANTGPAR